MVCTTTDRSGPVLPLGYPGTFGVGRSRCDDHSHTSERINREQSQDSTNQADEIQGRTSQTNE